MKHFDAVVIWLMVLVLVVYWIIELGTLEHRVTDLERAAGVTTHCGPLYKEFWTGNGCPPGRHGGGQ